MHLRVDSDEWLEWAARHAVRADIRNFISFMPEALMRPVPSEPVPFSTPRAWALLSRALDLAETSGILNRETRRALTFGRLSSEDAAVFCALAEESIGPMRPIECYIEDPSLLPSAAASRWFILDCVRQNVRNGKFRDLKPRTINRFLRSLPAENQLTLLTSLVEQWGALGADRAMLDLLKKVTAL
jgi:hypothetical protein